MRPQNLWAVLYFAAVACGGSQTPADSAPVATTPAPTPEPPVPEAPSAEPQPSAQPPPSAAPTAEPTPPDPNKRKDGEACSTAEDCQSGVCEGEGCGPDEARCAPKNRSCTRDLRVYCGCDGKEFRTSGSCPGRPYRARGNCVK